MFRKLRSCMTCYCVLLIILVILGLAFGKLTGSYATPTATAVPTATLSPAATHEEAAMFYGSTYGDNYLTMTKANTITQSIDGSLSLNLNIHYTGSTNSKICVRTCVEYILCVSDALKDFAGDFDNVQFVITSDGYVDKYGNPVHPIVMTAKLSWSTMSKVNYAYFLRYLDLSTKQPLEAFDSYYVHEQLSDGVY